MAMKAQIVSVGPGSTTYTRNPMNRTVIISIKKERARKEQIRKERDAQRVMSGRFNSIRGLEKLGK